MNAVKTIESLTHLGFGNSFGIRRLKCKIIFIVARALPNTDMGSNNYADSRFYRAWWACYSSGASIGKRHRTARNSPAVAEAFRARRREELHSFYSEGCHNRQQAHQARSNRKPVKLFEQRTVFGTTPSTDPTELIPTDLNSTNLKSN